MRPIGAWLLAFIFGTVWHRVFGHEWTSEMSVASSTLHFLETLIAMPKMYHGAGGS